MVFDSGGLACDRYRDPILTIEFYQLDAAASKPYSGPYQRQEQMLPEDIQFLVETKGATLRGALQTISALSGSVDRLNDSIKWIKWSFPLIVAITGVTLAVVASMLLAR